MKRGVIHNDLCVVLLLVGIAISWFFIGYMFGARSCEPRAPAQIREAVERVVLGSYDFCQDFCGDKSAGEVSGDYEEMSLRGGYEQAEGLRPLRAGEDKAYGGR